MLCLRFKTFTSQKRALPCFFCELTQQSQEESKEEAKGLIGDRRESKMGVELRVTCEQPRLWPAFLRGQQEKQGMSQDRYSFDSNITF